MSVFEVQLTNQKVRVTLHPVGKKKTLYARFWLDGKPHNPSTGQHVEREARVQARKLVERIAARTNHGVIQPINDVVENYLLVRWPNVKPGNSSYLGAKGRLNRFAAWCIENGLDDWHVLPLVEATAGIQKFIDHRRKSVGAETLKSDRVVISALCSYLIKRNLTTWPANPAAANRIESPRVVRTIKAPLAKEAIEDFLTAIYKHPLHPVCVLILSGMRPKAALVDLHWKDIDLENGRVITTEKGRPRQLPLTEWAVTELKRFVADPKTRVWTNSKRKGFSHCEALAIANSTPEISLQALRRAFIFRLWQMGVSPQLASRLAGNTVETAMRHYADSSLLDAGPALAKLDWMNVEDKKVKQDHTKTTPNETSK